MLKAAAPDGWLERATPSLLNHALVAIRRAGADIIGTTCHARQGPARRPPHGLRASISDCLLRYCRCVLRVFVVTMRTRTSPPGCSPKTQQISPGGVDSPVRAFKSVGATPLFVERGRGARLRDVDGNEFIDYVMSWGPLIHDHAPADLIRKLKAALNDGTSYGAPSPLEIDLGERVDA